MFIPYITLQYLYLHLRVQSMLIRYLTISRRRRDDYKTIFTEPKARWLQDYIHWAEGEATEPEGTNCFSINFQVFTNNNQHNFKNSLKSKKR